MEKSEVPPPISTTKARFFGVDLALIVESCGDGFQLEFDVLEAGQLGRMPELILGTLVGRLIPIDEMHGSADDDGRRPAAASRTWLMNSEMISSNWRRTPPVLGLFHR